MPISAHLARARSAGSVRTAADLPGVAGAPPSKLDSLLSPGDEVWVEGEQCPYRLEAQPGLPGTWTYKPLGSAPEMAIEVTCAEMNALNASNSAIPGQAYIVTDFNRGTLGPARILVHGVEDGSVGHTADVSTAFDDSAWSGRFDPDTCRVYDLRDNRGNYVRGDIGTEVEAFPWGNGNVYGNDFHGVTFLYTAGTVGDNRAGPTVRLEVNVGDVRFNDFSSNADVRVTGGYRMYRSTFDRCRFYANDGTAGEIDYSHVSGDAYVEPGRTTIERCEISNLADVRLRGTTGRIDNSQIGRCNFYVRNCANMDIDDLSIDSLGRVLGDGSTRLRILRCDVTSYGYIQAAAGGTMVAQYCNASSLGYIRVLGGGNCTANYCDVSSRGYITCEANSTLSLQSNSCQNLGFIRSRNGGRLNANYNNCVSRGYIDHASTGTNTASNNNMASNAYMQFLETCTGTLMDNNDGVNNGRFQMRGTAPAGSRIHRCSVSNGRITVRDGTGSRVFYSNVHSSQSYINVNAAGNLLIRDVNCVSWGRMTVNQGRTGQIGGIEVNSTGFVRARNGTGSLLHSSFGAYFYYYIDNQTATKQGIRGYGRQTYNEPSPGTAYTGPGVHNL